MVAAIDGSVALILEQGVPRMQALHAVKDNLGLMARAMRNAIFTNDDEAIREEIGIIETARRQSDEWIQDLGAGALPALERAHAEYARLQSSFIEMAAGHRAEDASFLLKNDLDVQQGANFAALDEALEDEVRRMQAAGAVVRSDIASVRLVVVVVGVLSMLGAVALALWIIRLVAGLLTEAVTISNAVARGDLTLEIAAQGCSETARLLAALKSMQGRLAAIVAAVRQGAEGVATASAEIASGNHDLSARTESQASALEQTVASMDELSSTVRHNADSAQEASRLAAGASAVAERGGAVMTQVVETMGSIHDASRRIADITGVIDGIAFQTNILALKAAVEAARAGEQGRGFAVVAIEVRSLPQRSADAAREIKALIQASVERVAHGGALAEQAGTTMGEVVTSIRQVAGIVAEISTASSEQTAGVRQVGEAIAQTDQATQRNAALVEQMAASAGGLKQQAGDLLDVVAVFRLADDAAALIDSSPRLMLN